MFHLGIHDSPIRAAMLAAVLSTRNHVADQSRGIIDAMRTTIDKAGRLVIPRSLRDRIVLAAGGEVELELDGATVRIEPVSGSDLREHGGLMVIPATGTRITGAAVRELIDADRHGR